VERGFESSDASLLRATVIEEHLERVVLAHPN
jgi:hypothetical protein